MKKDNFITKDFNGLKITQRLSDGFYLATDILESCNLNSDSKKRFKDFWENKGIKQLYVNISTKLNTSKLHDTIRGNKGGTWMHEELLMVFYNWVYKIPNQTITRDEIVFCDYIEESFKGILTFERQKRFLNYHVDLYCDELKLCIEFDESHHRKNKNTNLDEERQKQIENEFCVNFIRHDDRDNYSITINKIINYKMSYNMVNCIKNNKVPRLGFL